MKRLFLISILSMLLLSTAFAQEENTDTRIPQLVNFSATVRDVNNEVLANAAIFVRLTFLAGGKEGTPVNCSWYETTTNANGFMSILINRDARSWETGDSTCQFEDIRWQDGNYWMKVEYKISSSLEWIELGTLELSSTFYAFAARRSEVAEKLDGFNINTSGAQNGCVLVYNENANRWEARQMNIPDNLSNIPTNLSQLGQDVHYVITEVDPTVPAWAKQPTKPTYSYSELQGKPDLSIYLTTETDPGIPAWAKSATKPVYSYSELQNTPTDVTAFTNDANYVSTENQNLADVVALGNSANGQIKNVTDPTDAQDVATKAYVDSMLTALRANMLDSIAYSRVHGVINGYTYADLGLPSGLKWATCNVGATSPEGFGDYYAWGETTTKTSYTQGTYTYSDDPEILPLSNDAAAVNWGGGWRMPTDVEIAELVENCTWTVTTMNGVNGCKATGPNGNYIFLPFAGVYMQSDPRLNEEQATGGGVWSSSHCGGQSTDKAKCLYISTSEHNLTSRFKRVGFPVRPVVSE